ncbi:hypothetical protein G9X68_23865 [Rhizobium sp. WYCCWR 11279]|uniref:hypothetical protein n=1 Tax=Rhizobium TaxID=379 RepID=UPI0014924F99|nr:MULTISPECIES: hypothetical protein [Rhizobium]MCH4547983.1 hypothetical protein [Rhizobium changzhiense]MCV9945857.1 hypothetical protein [Rhizobium sp. BT-175]MCW0019701.1 hypothetical protein [Rhizobium sp. BT-226]NNU50108.1 hypothetical protein [Rhizobium changzhiense]
MPALFRQCDSSLISGRNGCGVTGKTYLVRPGSGVLMAVVQVRTGNMKPSHIA